MNPFEDDIVNDAVNAILLWFLENNIFRTNDNVNRFVCFKPFVNTFKIQSFKMNQEIVFHDTINDVAFSNEICCKAIFRLIVNRFRCPDLLDNTILHNNNRIAHRECFFLIMGDKHETDT